jgi:hypothetical protein
MEGRDTEFWCFLAKVIINIGIIGLPNMKDYWSQEWSYHVTFFKLHIFKRQIYANILDASAFPHTTNYRTTNKDKNNALQLMLKRNQQICSSDGNWLMSYLQTGW